MILPSATAFTTLSSDFCLARLLLILMLWRWKRYRGGFGSSQQVRSQLSGRGGCVVNGCSVVLWCLETKAPGSTGRAQDHCFSPACMGLPMGEWWSSDLQQRCGNGVPVLDRPAFSWPSLWRRDPGGRCKKRGSSTNTEGRLGTSQLWNVIPTKQSSRISIILHVTQRLGN